MYKLQYNESKKKKKSLTLVLSDVNFKNERQTNARKHNSLAVKQPKIRLRKTGGI